MRGGGEWPPMQRKEEVWLDDEGEWSPYSTVLRKGCGLVTKLCIVGLKRWLKSSGGVDRSQNRFVLRRFELFTVEPLIEDPPRFRTTSLQGTTSWSVFV